LSPRSHLFLPAFFAAILLAGCNPAQPERAPVLGTAYAGPAILNLHRDIDPKSPIITIVHHGDKLDIVGQRRRSWYRVRTAKGIEGWTSNGELLDSGQMARLRALAAETAGMPSQGVASTFSPLNMHSEPNRLAPSFAQLAEHEKFDVIAHRVEARKAPPKRELIPEKPKEVKAPSRKGKSKKTAPAEPPPPPVAVTPPPPAEAAPVVSDDWTLIRTPAGQSGWVLTSALYLQVPDDVAQYAEGHRITSYFSIGKIADGDQQKDIWLWTTSDGLGEDHDFDGFRVFTWSLRHHRYETAYIQRRERGFFPVIAKTGEFSVCLEKPGDMRIRKKFTLVGNAVRPSGDSPCDKAADVDAPAQNLAVATAPEPVAHTGLVDRVKARVNALFGRKH
jgi:hypothetical protein